MVSRLNGFENNVIQKLLSLLVVVVIFCAGFWMLWSITGAQPLVNDEAVYLTKARSWIEGTPANEWKIYRPIGMVGFGWVFLHFSNTESAVRVFGDIFGAITLVFIYLLFKRMVNFWVALSMVCLIGTSPLFLQQASQFLNDGPSAGLLIGVLWIIWTYYTSSERSNIVYMAAPLAALAFYTRYGVVISIGVICLLTVAILGRKYESNKNVDHSQLAITFVIFILLLVPHFIQSYNYDNSALGILSRSGAAAGREYLGQGFFDYIQLLPNELSGRIVGSMTILGIIVTVISLFIKKTKQEYEGLLWLGGIGLFIFILTGILVHAEARYVFFPLVLLSGVGIMGVYFLVASKQKIIANILIAIFIAITLYFGTTYYKDADNFFKGREENLSRNAYVEASEVIRKDNPTNKKCAVWASTFRPEISWYSKCNTLDIKDAPTFQRDFLKHYRKSHYSITFTNLKNQQVSEENAKEYGVFLTEIYRSKRLSHVLGELVVYRIGEITIEKDTIQNEYGIQE